LMVPIESDSTRIEVKKCSLFWASLNGKPASAFPLVAPKQTASPSGTGRRKVQ
jgi:hypothetical protein